MSAEEPETFHVEQQPPERRCADAGRLRRMLLPVGLSAWCALELSCARKGAPETPFRPSPPEAHIEARRCGECHAAIFEEWRGSAHGTAWRNPRIRAASNDFQILMCQPCHSAEPILATGPGKMPIHRAHHQEESIGCLTCHGLPGGEPGVATSNPSPDRSAFCRPRTVPAVSGVDLCGACHNPTHFVVDEWRASSFPARGLDCNACHMPAAVGPVADGGAARRRRSHRFPGCRDPAFLASAIEAHVSVRDGRVEATVWNKAGHQFPGEFPDRELHIVASFLKGDEVVEQKRIVLKPPPRSARALPPKDRDALDNRLRPDETRTFRFDPPALAERAKVKLIYKRFPTVYDHEASMLKEADLPLKK